MCGSTQAHRHAREAVAFAKEKKLEEAQAAHVAAAEAFGRAAKHADGSSLSFLTLYRQSHETQAAIFAARVERQLDAEQDATLPERVFVPSDEPGEWGVLFQGAILRPASSPTRAGRLRTGQLTSFP